jgi:hypothetical protein
MRYLLFSMFNGIDRYAVQNSSREVESCGAVGLGGAEREHGDGRDPVDVPGRRTADGALDSEHPPLRLALGNDAVDAISESLETAKAELAAWERVGRSAVFD